MSNLIKKIRHLASVVWGSRFLFHILPLKYFIKIIRVRYRIRQSEKGDDLNPLYHLENDILSDYCCNCLLVDFDCDFPIVENVVSTGTEPIWICWLQGKDKLPELNQMCCRSIEQFSNGHPLKFIDDVNVHDYLDIPSYIKKQYENKNIKPAIYADYIRCALLAKYGGLWLDSTILLTDTISEEAFQTEFYSIKNAIRDHWSVSYYRWASFIMGTTQNSHFFRLVQQMFEYYLSRYKVNFTYVMIDFFFETIYKKNLQFKTYIDNRPFSNPQMHELRFGLNKQYSESCFQQYTIDTSVFKLTYKTELVEETVDGQKTIYNYLLDKFMRA